MDNSDKQMTMLLEEGGIADDGMNVDPVSGNEIPPGSLAEEVRDDIPAQLSEGEYVVPADVLRFYGVKFFEDLRTQAKQGLMDMEQNGRIGGEPVMMAEQEGADPFTPEEKAALASIGMAVGGMVPQPTQSTMPMQQAQMYQQPAPVAMGNVGYSKGGLEMSDITTEFDPIGLGRGSSIDRILNRGTTQRPELKSVIMYGPGGEVITLTLPVQQDLYDQLVEQGYSEEQVAVTTETEVSKEKPDADGDGGGVDIAPTPSNAQATQGEQQGFFAETPDITDIGRAVFGIVTGNPAIAIDEAIEAVTGKSGKDFLAEILGIETKDKDGDTSGGLMGGLAPGGLFGDVDEDGVPNVVDFNDGYGPLDKSKSSESDAPEAPSDAPEAPSIADQAEAEAEVGLEAFGGDGNNGGNADAAGGANASGPSADSSGPSGNAGESEAATGGVGDVGLGSGPGGLNEGGIVQRPKKRKKK